MSVARSVSDVLGSHVTLEIESIDRMYLNLYVPILQRPEGAAHFCISHRGHRFASSAILAPMTKSFVASIEKFAVSHGVDLIPFAKGQRKDDIAHEYLKRQLDREGIAYEALDNGLLSCEDPDRAQALCDDLSAAKIDALARKWLRRLPHPFPADDRRAGYLYDISILQAEFSLTQVLDRPVTGRIFFEQVIRDNIDLGRPDRIQLVFNRRVTKRTPGLFRTRIITQGVIPSLYVDYKHTRIKQYHKEGRALRTETTINDTRDFAIGKRLQNLPALREDTNKSRVESPESRASTAHTGPFQLAAFRFCGRAR